MDRSGLGRLSSHPPDLGRPCDDSKPRPTSTVPLFPNSPTRVCTASAPSSGPLSFSLLRFLLRRINASITANMESIASTTEPPIIAAVWLPGDLPELSWAAPAETGLRPGGLDG